MYIFSKKVLTFVCGKVGKRTEISSASTGLVNRKRAEKMQNFDEQYKNTNTVER